MTFDQLIGLIMLGLALVLGIGLLIDGYGGWPIFWYELKKGFRRKK